MRKKFLNLDRFGHEVNLNYKGQSEFKTLVGSVVTLLTYTVIIINALAIFGDYISSEN